MIFILISSDKIQITIHIILLIVMIVIILRSELVFHAEIYWTRSHLVIKLHIHGIETSKIIVLLLNIVLLIMETNIIAILVEIWMFFLKVILEILSHILWIVWKLFINRMSFLILLWWRYHIIHLVKVLELLSLWIVII